MLGTIWGVVLTSDDSPSFAGSQPMWEQHRLNNAGYVIGEGYRHIGSPALRVFIENNQSKLVVCGHIHQSVGVERIGKTVVVNTAQSATLITIDDAGEIEAEIIG